MMKSSFTWTKLYEGSHYMSIVKWHALYQGIDNDPLYEVFFCNGRENVLL